MIVDLGKQIPGLAGIVEVQCSWVFVDPTITEVSSGMRR